MSEPSAADTDDADAGITNAAAAHSTADNSLLSLLAMVEGPGCVVNSFFPAFKLPATLTRVSKSATPIARALMRTTATIDMRQLKRLDDASIAQIVAYCRAHDCYPDAAKTLRVVSHSLGCVSTLSRTRWRGLRELHIPFRYDDANAGAAAALLAGAAPTLRALNIVAYFQLERAEPIRPGTREALSAALAQCAQLHSLAVAPELLTGTVALHPSCVLTALDVAPCTRFFRREQSNAVRELRALAFAPTSALLRHAARGGELRTLTLQGYWPPAEAGAAAGAAAAGLITAACRAVEVLWLGDVACCEYLGPIPKLLHLELQSGSSDPHAYAIPLRSPQLRVMRVWGHSAVHERYEAAFPPHYVAPGAVVGAGAALVEAPLPPRAVLDRVWPPLLPLRLSRTRINIDDLRAALSGPAGIAGLRAVCGTVTLVSIILEAYAVDALAETLAGLAAAVDSVRVVAVEAGVFRMGTQQAKLVGVLQALAAASVGRPAGPVVLSLSKSAWGMQVDAEMAKPVAARRPWAAHIVHADA